MSKMKDLSLEIENLLNEDYHPISIAVMLNVPVSMVYDVLEMLSQQEPVDG